MHVFIKLGSLLLVVALDYTSEEAEFSQSFDLDRKEIWGPHKCIIGSVEAYPGTSQRNGSRLFSICIDVFACICVCARMSDFELQTVVSCHVDFRSNYETWSSRSEVSAFIHRALPLA